MLRIPPVPPKELVVRLARTREELEAAFAILHDAYVAEDFMKPHPSGLRVTPYHALPSTSTIIAEWNGKVVGTLSIIRDNPFGLPMETIFDIEHLRAKPKRVAEISALAIAKEYRSKRGEILFPLFKFVYEYCIHYFGVDYMLIAVNPRDADLYEGLLFFEHIEKKVIDHYEFVNGAPAIGRFLNLRKAYERMEKTFAHRPPEANPFFYFAKQKLENLQFPERRNHSISDPIMTPELLDYFFNQKTKVFEELNPRSKAILNALYPSPRYKSILPATNVVFPVIYRRQNRRHDVKSTAKIHFQANGISVTAHVRDVSKGGFSAYVERPIRFETTLIVHLAIGPSDVIQLVASPRWTDEKGMYGFSIEVMPREWIQFIRELEMRLDQEVAEVATL
jgi:hypothetical protein